MVSPTDPYHEASRRCTVGPGFMLRAWKGHSRHCVACFERLKQPLEPGEADSQAAACIEKMDNDGDGAISFQEFMEVIGALIVPDVCAFLWWMV